MARRSPGGSQFSVKAHPRSAQDTEQIETLIAIERADKGRIHAVILAEKEIGQGVPARSRHNQLLRTNDARDPQLKSQSTLVPDAADRWDYLLV